MKAEHRKELEKNSLTTLLEESAERLKKGPSRTSLYVLGGLVLVGVLVFTWMYFANNAWTNDAMRWLRWEKAGELASLEERKKLEAKLDKEELVQTLGPSERAERMEMLALDQFIADNSGTTQERLARFKLFRLQLHAGMRDLGNTGYRARALKDLNKAAEGYEKLIGESTGVQLLTQEALFNAGKAREALGDFTKALTHYKQLARDFQRTELGKSAEEQVKRLEDPNNKKILEALKDRYVTDVKPQEGPVTPVPPKN